MMAQSPSDAGIFTTTAQWNLDLINGALCDASPRTIAVWALAQRQTTIVSTSFGAQSAATLHLMAGLKADLPVVWVDTGLSDDSTRQFATDLTRRLGLNLQTYKPDQSAEQLLQRQGVTDLQGLAPEDQERLVDRIKLAPFDRALKALQPVIWISGMRAEQTEFRSSLAPVTLDSRGILKVAPFFNATAEDMAVYLDRYDLPRNSTYHDATKAAPHLECGLHTRRPAA